MIKPCLRRAGVPAAPKRHFTVGIHDDVTHLSLRHRRRASAYPAPAGEVQAVFFGLGSDGTVGANKSSVKIIGEGTDLLRPGLLRATTPRSRGSVTVSHLRFGPEPIRSTYLIDERRLRGLPPVRAARAHEGARLRPGRGRTFLLNSPLPGRRGVGPPAARGAAAADRQAPRVLGHRRRHRGPEVGHGQPHQHRHAALLLPALPACCRPTRPSARIKDAVEQGLRPSAATAIVERNFAAIDRALAELARVARARPGSRATGRIDGQPCPTMPREFVRRRHRAPLMAGEGDLLPVSALPVDGTFPTGTAQVREAGHRPADPHLGSRRSASTAASAPSSARTPRSA